MLPLSDRLRLLAPATGRHHLRLCRADAAMLGAMLLWGLNISAAKVVVRAVAPTAFGLLRYTLVALVLGVLLRQREGRLGVARRDLVRLALVGGVGLGVYQLCFLAGLRQLSASLAALLLAVAPLLTAVAAAAWAHEPLGRRSGLVLTAAPTGDVRRTLAPFSLVSA